MMWALYPHPVRRDRRIVLYGSQVRAPWGGHEALEFVEPALDLIRRHPSTRTTTRRFFARPSRSSLEATGWSSP